MKDGFWTEARLTTCFRLVLEQKHQRLNLCLFIDALDEYGGTPEGIAQFLGDISGYPHPSLTTIKICFSSRPWDAFEKRFANCPTITVHEETREDIRQYCLGRMGPHLQALGPLRELVDEIVRLSIGVFLWVRLVVEDLQEILNDASKNGTVPTAGELQQRLESFPQQLDLY